jgi:hypothetical protein
MFILFTFRHNRVIIYFREITEGIEYLVFSPSKPMLSGL